MHSCGPSLFWDGCNETQILGPQVVDYITCGLIVWRQSVQTDIKNYMLCAILFLLTENTTSIERGDKEQDNNNDCASPFYCDGCRQDNCS